MTNIGHKKFLQGKNLQKNVLNRDDYTRRQKHFLERFRRVPFALRLLFAILMLNSCGKEESPPSKASNIQTQREDVRDSGSNSSVPSSNPSDAVARPFDGKWQVISVGIVTPAYVKEKHIAYEIPSLRSFSEGTNSLYIEISKTQSSLTAIARGDGPGFVLTIPVEVKDLGHNQILFHPDGTKFTEVPEYDFQKRMRTKFVSTVEWPPNGNLVFRWCHFLFGTYDYNIVKNKITFTRVGNPDIQIQANLN